MAVAQWHLSQFTKATLNTMAKPDPGPKGTVRAPPPDLPRIRPLNSTRRLRVGQVNYFVLRLANWREDRGERQAIRLVLWHLAGLQA